MNENSEWQKRLYTPTMIQKIDNTYFIVDCWHNRILYNDNIDDYIKEWHTLANDIYGGHTISGNGEMFLADDTEHGSLRIFKRIEGKFKETQRIPCSGTRPHFTFYDKEENCFWTWLSTGSILVKLNVKNNEKLTIAKQFQLPGAEKLYIRSFSVIDNMIYFVSGGGAIRILDYKKDFSVKEIPVPPEFDGMNYIAKINDYFYITSYTTKNFQISPRFVRLKNLLGLMTGDYEDLYDKFGFKGVPYYISSFDGRYFISEIDQASGYTSFILNGHEIEDIKTHARFDGVIPASFNKKQGGGAILYAEEYAGKDISDLVKDKFGGGGGYHIGKIYVDLSHHTAKDSYSDGDIEDELLLAAKKGKLQELLEADKRWPVFYHATSDRENLLDFLPADKNARALEIGSGCGGVTGVLAEKVGFLETVEISQRRADITAYRHCDKDNITIHVGNLNDIEFEEKFDIITLIGVLEYAPSFTHTANPFADFLTKIRSLLKDDGVLIIAIENRLGLKYWSGANEDHLGRRFIGITGYKGVGNVKTFSKAELRKLMNEVGFNSLEWYYPYPDYKIPVSLYSDRQLPSKEEMLGEPNHTWDQDRYEFFSEKEAFGEMLSAELFDEFANSFLLFARKNETVESNKKPSAVHHSFGRNPQYNLITEFFIDSSGKKRIVKVARTKEQQNHLKAIAKNYKILSKVYGKEHIAEAKMISSSEMEVEYIEGESLLKKMQNALLSGKNDEFMKLLIFYRNDILKGTNDNSLLPKNISPYDANRKYDIDLNFDHIVFTKDGYKIFDCEWLYPAVSKNFILWRALSGFYGHSREIMAKIQPNQMQFYLNFGYTPEQINAYMKEEQRFQASVSETYEYKYIRQRLKMQ